MSNHDKIKKPSMGGGEIMPQFYSTDSFNMGERGRVFLFIQDTFYVFRSFNINYYTFDNQRIT